MRGYDKWKQRPEKSPKIIGCCEECGGEMYDYEITQCDCGKEVHKRCMVECANCKSEGCKDCMTYDEDLGEWLCGAECKEEFENKH